ncbi:ras guanine nucleotide exchange factor Q [Melanaphis sacchari]|uniref:ras guanine nucleotide exchange factor Q n=1 Tax=Melanaphis sacchari TaxID=742174 RepID=UPI000DC1337E|nr:ras guanine nucleotide exchange factor Q [Melanaphis sacchari]
MEFNDYYSTHKSSANEEEALLKRLIALKKQLDDDDDDNDDKPKLQQTLNNVKENIVTNKDIKLTSKFKYRKDNNHIANKFLSTKIDNRNFTNQQNKIKQNSLFAKTNNSSKVYTKQNVLHFTSIKTVTSKKNPEISNNSQNITKFNSEINEIMKNSFVNNCKLSSNDNCYETSDVSQILHNVDKYMINVQDYLTSSKYVINKEVSSSSTKKTNQSKNVHVNRKFQNQLISNSLLNSNLKSLPNSLVSINKSTSINKKKIIKKLSGKTIGSPNLVKIGNTKLIRQSLFRNKWKINNKINCVENNATERKPLSTLQCPSSNTLIPSYKKTEWTKVTNSTPVLKSKLSNTSNTNKLKWTRPSILLVNNVKNNTHTSVPKTDKLILFGKNKIIRQSLINPIQSKPKSYMLKHLSHRFALIRKLQQKNIVAKIKTVTNNEQVKNMLLKNTLFKPIEIKKNGKGSYSVYSYVNPILRSKTYSYKLEKTGSSNNKIRLLNISNNKPQQNLKIINNEKNKIQNLSLTNNKTLQRLKSKKTLTKQLCLVFNRFGVCSKLDQGECDKRHYKKYITLCTKFLTGECFKENCTLSHNIVEEKIPFCKHYLNSVCVQLNCPYLHEYRSKNTPICKKFLDGSCNWGKKCPKKHLNLCPIFETKNECPHGQKCLYPHIPCEEKNTVVEINEPRYFEISIPNNIESNENESIHIVPKRRAPLLDLPSFIPLKKQ